MTNGTEEPTHGTAEFCLPFSYCGLLDDVVARYDGRFADPDLFNRLLVKSLFFGGGLYINDGYLFMHAAARRQMLDPNSVLCTMLEYGFARIFTRTTSLEKLIGLVDSSDVPSHKDFQGTPDWKQLRKRWELICRNAWRGGKVTFWGEPRNHKIQATLYERQLSRDPEELGLTCDRVVVERVKEQLFSSVNQAENELNPYAKQARTRFEIACRNAIAGSGPLHKQEQQLRELMRLGNECYHYAFGASLSWQQRTAVAVDTLMSSAFDSLIIRPHIDLVKLESIPSFGIPVHVDLTQGERLIPLMDRTSSAFHAKVNFLQNFLDSYRVEESPNNEWINAAAETGGEYARALESLLPDTNAIEVLSGPRQPQVSLVRCSLPDSSNVALATVGVAAAVASEGEQILADGMTKLVLQDDVSRRFWKFTANEIVPQASTLAFHKSVVDEILSDPFMLNDDAVRESAG